MRWYLLLLVALMCALGVALPSGIPSAEARVVPAKKVERAFKMACPHLSTAKAKLWGGILKKQAKQRKFCPYTGVAIVWSETGRTCNETLIYDHSSGYYVGLGQINAYHRKECKEGGLDSPGCKMRIAELQNGAYNLVRMSMGITANRKFCRKKTGHPALFARWLSSYQGFNISKGRKGVWCNMRQDKRGRWRDVKTPHLTRKVMRYRRRLLRTLG
jgi:hypothetical protein